MSVFDEPKVDCHAHVLEILFPNPADRQRLFWDTPRRLLGFADAQ